MTYRYVASPVESSVLGQIQYLSQLKSDLQETFRISSWGSPEMVQHVKDDPVLQVSSQEPSMSSKYDFEDGGVLEALLNIVES